MLKLQNPIAMKFHNLQKRYFVIFAFIIWACSTNFQTNKNDAAIKTSSGKSNSSSIPYYPLEKNKDLDVLLNAIADARIVLLGESTHGTHEYYKWSEEITKRLVTEKGFNIVLIEGDWADS